MADSPKTEMPSSGEDYYHISTTPMQKWHQSVCFIVMPHHGESDKSTVQ